MENLEKAKSTPRDVFLYLLAIITLYISVWRYIDLLFGYINYTFPDQLYSGYFDGMFMELRISIASLFVVFPVYMGLTWYLRKDIIANPTKREMTVRKWLLNFTLFLAAITIIVDLITLVNNFLSGELTLRFVLKVAVVLIVASAVFAYYLWDLKRKTASGLKPNKLIALAASVVMLASIVSGFFIIGSPAEQRKMRFDERRVNDLQILQSQIISFWRQKERLPSALDELKSDISGFVPPKDPSLKIVYEYRTLGRLEFELCANFELASPSVFQDGSYGHMAYSEGVSYEGVGYGGPYGENWSHDKGRKCFRRTIDPALYRLPKQSAP